MILGVILESFCCCKNTILFMTRCVNLGIFVDGTKEMGTNDCLCDRLLKERLKKQFRIGCVSCCYV